MTGQRKMFEEWFADYHEAACRDFGGIDCTDPKGIADAAWQACLAAQPAPQRVAVPHEDMVREIIRESMLDVIRRLNQNPYSLTKQECISEIRAMLSATPQPDGDAHLCLSCKRYNKTCPLDGFDTVSACVEYRPMAPQPDGVGDVPDGCGWVFCTADFSLQAAGKSKTGSAMLVRDQAGRAWWNKLSDEAQEVVPLYMSGEGITVADAIADAVSRALLAKGV